MRAQGIRATLIPILLAGASLGFAQMNPNFGHMNANPAVAPSEPVGPGTVNYVEGQVTLNGQQLTPHSIGTARLNPGGELDTGQGYAELLLTPGAFLRVGNSSEVRITASGLADTRVEVLRGESILEVDQLIKGTNLAVSMNGATAHVEKDGLYDFNAAQQAILVLDGKATVEQAARKRDLNRKNEVLLGSKHPLKKRDFNERTVEAEPLYVWSKARSEDESQASVGAAQNADLYTMAGPGWYWDPMWDFYGFWPMNAELYSPFGWGFYSPAFFGFGYYGGGFWGGGHHPIWVSHPGSAGHPGWTHPVGRPVGGWHGSSSHFGGFGGFHGGGLGGGFHGGGGGHR